MTNPYNSIVKLRQRSEYPVVIHGGKKSDYGVTVPDLPGCFSAGATIDEVVAMVLSPVRWTARKKRLSTLEAYGQWWISIRPNCEKIRNG
jgi:HicB_like antitoxin of bacterial toxin-antitoxin system